MTARKRTHKATKEPSIDRRRTQPLPTTIGGVDSEIRTALARLAFHQSALAAKPQASQGGHVAHVARLRKWIVELERHGERLRKLEEGKDMNRRQLMVEDEQAKAKAAEPGMVYVADRRFQCDGFTYNRGCAVERERIPNFEKLVRAGFLVARLPGNVNAAIKPVAMPATAPQQQSVEPVVVNTGNAVEDWKRSLAETAKLYGGDVALAEDVLLANERGGELYRRAVRVAAENEAVAKRTMNRRSAEALRRA